MLKKLADYRYIAYRRELNEDDFWKTWEDFRSDHDMVLANWLSEVPLLIQGNEYNTEDAETGEYKPVYGYYAVGEQTIEDIKHYDIDIPYYENKEKELYAITVPFRGKSWSDVPLLYIYYQEENTSV